MGRHFNAAAGEVWKVLQHADPAACSQTFITSEEKYAHREHPASELFAGLLPERKCDLIAWNEITQVFLVKLLHVGAGVHDKTEQSFHGMSTVKRRRRFEPQRHILQNKPYVLLVLRDLSPKNRIICDIGAGIQAEMLFVGIV